MQIVCGFSPYYTFVLMVWVCWRYMFLNCVYEQWRTRPKNLQAAWHQPQDMSLACSTWFLLLSWWHNGSSSMAWRSYATFSHIDADTTVISARMILKQESGSKKMLRGIFPRCLVHLHLYLLRVSRVTPEFDHLVCCSRTGFSQSLVPFFE